MFLRCFLKRLRDDDNSDVEKNPNSCFERNQALDRLNRPGKTKKSDEQSIQCGIAGPRSEAVPTGMTKIDSRRKDAAEESCVDGADPITNERWDGVVTATHGYQELDMELRAKDVGN